MSRIGKQPINLNESVTATLEGQTLKVKGPKGELAQVLYKAVKADINDGVIVITPKKGARNAESFQGLTRTLVFNMVKGVTDGFEKKLEFHGVGYRAAVAGNVLTLNLGFSHPVLYTAPEGIEIKVEKNVITVAGIDKQKVGQVASEIRAIKKPEPYKGKGIRYVDERVRRKAGKTAAKGA